MGIPPVSLGSIAQASADPSAAQLQQVQQTVQQQQPQPQQQTPQPQQPQQGQQQQGQDQDPIRQQLLGKVQEAQNAKFGVKQVLQDFFAGMSRGMIPFAQTPATKQKESLANLNSYDSTRALVGLHQEQMAQYQPVPLIGMDQKPIMDPSTGKPITLPAAHAQTYYAGQLAASRAIQVQQMKGDTAETVQDLKNQGAQEINPVKRTMNEAVAAYNSGDIPTYQRKLQELGQLQGTTTAAARGDKWEQFKSTQQYNVWKTNQDNQTKTNIAAMNAGKAPAAMMQTAAFAQSGMNRLDDAQQAMQRLEARGVLGNVASNKIEDWIFGKGLVDPSLPAQDKEDIGKLRAALSYTSSAAMRAHTGRSSREIYDDFKKTVGLAQGPDALKGAIGETRSMLGDYASGATNAAIMKLRGGAGPNAPAPGGSSGRRVIDLR